jgi:membrane glycosyltransferase
MIFPGLHPLSRVHFLTGIVSYVSSPMWLALLLLSSVLSAIAATKEPQYFLPGFRSLFPHWPEIRSGEINALLMFTLVVLLLPKVLGVILAVRDRQLLRRYGGFARLCAGVLVEQLFSMLLAPSMMLFHSTFVAQILLGRSVSWGTQARTDRGVTLGEAFARQKWHLAFGLAWGASMWWLAPQFFWWLTPVLAGLICSVWLTVWTSRSSAGQWLRRWGVLLTPEETAPPRELRALIPPAENMVVACSTTRRNRALAAQAGGEPVPRPVAAAGHAHRAEVRSECSATPEMTRRQLLPPPR